MKKILFIIPYIPYPLNSGGNQAFFNMVDYLRHQMEVSLLLCAFSSRDEENITRLKEIWPDVSFYVFRRRSQFEALKPKLKHPRYYRWLEKVGNSVSRKMRRQVIQVEDHTRNMSVLPNSLFSDFEYGYVDYVGKVSRQGFDMIQVEFYELVALGYILPKEVDPFLYIMSCDMYAMRMNCPCLRSGVWRMSCISGWLKILSAVP